MANRNLTELGDCLKCSNFVRGVFWMVDTKKEHERDELHRSILAVADDLRESSYHKPYWFMGKRRRCKGYIIWRWSNMHSWWW